MRAGELPHAGSAGLAGLALATALVGCATPGPKETLDAYAAALRRGDLRAVRALSDPGFQAAYSPEGLADLTTDEERRVVAERLASVADGREFWIGTSPAGDEVRLVRDAGGWRVAVGGLRPARFDTPELALHSFLVGVAARRWSVVREAMPRRFRDAYATDEALARQVEALWPRIEAARAAIGPLTPGRARVSATRAELVYAGGRRAILTFEDGGWRVLDLE